MSNLTDFKNRVREKFKPGEGSRITWFSTGSYAVDRCLGRGLGRGRFHLWQGRESCCKTTLAIHAMVQCQLTNWETGEYDPSRSNPSPTMFVDLEATFDTSWAAKIGIPPDSLDSYTYVVRPENGEQAADIILNALESQCFGLIVVDSNEAFVSASTISKSAEDSVMCDRAKILSRMYRVGTSNLIAAQSKIDKPWQVPTVLCLNQVRDTIGSTHGGYIAPGGRAQNHYSSTILQFNSPHVYDDSTKSYGIGTFKGVSKKNKLHPPKKSFEFTMALKDLRDASGNGLAAGQIDNASSILRDVKALDLMQKTSDGWQILGEIYRVQSDFKDRVNQDIDFQRMVWQQLLELDRE